MFKYSLSSHSGPIVSKGSPAGTNHVMCSPFGCGQPWVEQGGLGLLP